MQIDLVDERDISWEDDQPEFRVLLYDPAIEQAAKDVAFNTATYRLADCSVSQALAWARSQDSGGFVLYLIVKSDDRIGTVLLEGPDPWKAQREAH